MRIRPITVNAASWFSSHLDSLLRYEVKLYYSDLFQVVNRYAINSRRILEIGSGSGLSQKFLVDTNYFKSDIIIDGDNIDVAADVYELPFLNESFEFVFALDLFHHLQRPDEAIMEVHRILKPTGLLLMIEPHVSFFSYPIYKVFHHEKTSWRIGPEKLCLNISDDPLDADNAAMTSLIYFKKWRITRERLKKYFYFEGLFFRDFLGFFLTGGLQRKSSLVKGRIYLQILKAEKSLPHIFLQFFGSRLVLCLIKK